MDLKERGLKVNKDLLKRDLEQKAVDLFEKRGGSAAVQVFTDAKQACLDAGIPWEEIVEIVHAVTRGVGRNNA